MLAGFKATLCGNGGKVALGYPCFNALDPKEKKRFYKKQKKIYPIISQCERLTNQAPPKTDSYPDKVA